MRNKTKYLGLILFFLSLIVQINISGYAGETFDYTKSRYPDYACMYLGKDKCETFNRKMFNFNLGLNKYIVKPVHIVWASVMPKYGMERIKGIYTNIEYPKRLVSTLVQKDFKSSGRETLRFLTNSTLGLAGMFDPAKRFFKIEPVNENMEQALAKCKCSQGPFLVVPCIPATTARGLAGKALDTALNPTCYIGTPILALIKLGFTINQTADYEPLAEMIQSTYADPYDIAKKLYGIDNYIKANNLDRKDVLETNAQIYQDDFVETVNNEIEEPAVAGETLAENKDVNPIASEKVIDGERWAYSDFYKEGISKTTGSFVLKNEKPKADIILDDYNPQTPVIDAMRTALFDLPGIEESIWSEFSVWNRCFKNRLRISRVNIDPAKEDYRFKYLIQKDKNSPVVIIYPSIGEGISSHHSVIMAKLFYDEGYSVIIQGSHFQWEFVKSMPDGYIPGIPAQDADYLKTVTSKILKTLEDKYNCKFGEKVLIGTSFGALETLFLADKEYKNNTLGITKFISINPPIELLYAMRQVDKNNEEWQKNPDNLKERVAITAAKILQLLDEKENPGFKIDRLPFSDSEAKIITGFIMHQKLSDLIFTIEGVPKNKSSDFYENMNNMSYEDYMKKYILSKDKLLSYDDLNYDSSLYSIAEYLECNNNYKIFHTLDDYLVNQKQLAQLKKYAKGNAVFVSNGSHLGYMYRPEFIEALKKEISLTPPASLASKSRN